MAKAPTSGGPEERKRKARERAEEAAKRKADAEGARDPWETFRKEGARILGEDDPKKVDPDLLFKRLHLDEEAFRKLWTAIYSIPARGIIAMAETSGVFDQGQLTEITLKATPSESEVDMTAASSIMLARKYAPWVVKYLPEVMFGVSVFSFWYTRKALVKEITAFIEKKGATT